MSGQVPSRKLERPSAPSAPRPPSLVVGSPSANGAPALPGDVEDHQGDRQSDDRVGDRQPQADDGRADEDAEADEAIDACVVAVGDECGAVETLARPGADAGGNLVAEEADDAGGGEPPKMRQLAWVDE